MLAEPKRTYPSTLDATGRTPRSADRASRRTPASTRSGFQDRQAVAAQLLHRCADGDHEALSDLHDLYAGSLQRQVRSIVRSPEAAEEVVQEVFLYVWKRASTYDSRRAAVSTWLTRIARSRAIDHLRKASTRARTRESVASVGVSSIEPNAERNVLTHQWRRRLQAALEGLPAAQRETLMLAYYGEMTQPEIAAEVQIPLGTVKTRTHLAMRKLREEFATERLEAF